MIAQLSEGINHSGKIDPFLPDCTSDPFIGAQITCEGWSWGALRQWLQLQGRAQSVQKERVVIEHLDTGEKTGYRGESWQRMLDELGQARVSVKNEGPHQTPGSCMSKYSLMRLVLKRPVLRLIGPRKWIKNSEVQQIAINVLTQSKKKVKCSTQKQ